MQHKATNNEPTPAQKALSRATWARTMTKVVVSRYNKTAPYWQVLDFLGQGKQESAGIIDLLAIRKDHAGYCGLPKGDGFEIVMIQVKGGKARNPSPADIERLRAVREKYGARAVVLSSWAGGALPQFRVLEDEGWSEPVDPKKVFAKRKKVVPI